VAKLTALAFCYVSCAAASGDTPIFEVFTAWGLREKKQQESVNTGAQDFIAGFL